METVIYLDVLFIVNFSMDFISIYLCAKLLRYNVSLPAFILCSGIGGIYGVCEVFMGVGGFFDILINIMVTMLLCFVAFGLHSFIILLRNTLVLYGIGFGLGGSMTALYYALNRIIRNRITLQNGDEAYYLKSPDLKSFFPVLLLCIIGVYILGRIISRHKNKKTVLLKIEFEGKSVEINGLCDSGNLLYEPLSSLPCVVCSYRKIESLFDIGLKKMFETSQVGIMEFVSPEIAKKLRIVPLSGVGTDGILIGFIPDRATLDGEEKEFCVACEKKDTDYAGFDCIVPSSLV